MTGLWVALIILLLLAPIWWITLTETRRAESPNDLSQLAVVDPSRVRESFPAAHRPASLPPDKNYVFLQSVRERSCYRNLRDVHTFISYAAIGVIAIAWIVLLNLASVTVDRVYATLVCGLVIVAAVIEYGFFRMVVDAVDVLIDMGRRASERE